MKALSAATVVLALLASPSHAQLTNKPEKDPLELQYEQEEKARQQADKDYDATMKQTRSNAPAAKRDPWGNVRPANNPGAKR